MLSDKDPLGSMPNLHEDWVYGCRSTSRGATEQSVTTPEHCDDGNPFGGVVETIHEWGHEYTNYWALSNICMRDGIYYDAFLKDSNML